MPKINFPHILEEKAAGLSDRLLRFVTDQDLETGDLLVSKSKSVYDPETTETNNFYHTYNVLEIFEKRPAKGDWSAWPKHPFYYDCRLKYAGEVPEDKVADILPSQV